MHYWFTWNGTDCRTRGVLLQEMPQIVKPEERVEHVTIPGRSGEVTITEGNDIYNSYIQTIPIIVTTASDVSTVEKWLRGNGYVSFCSQPELKQKARVINAVEFKKHSRNSDWWEAQVQFYCHPLKEQVLEEQLFITSSGTTITNPGDIESRPMMQIFGSGQVTITAGGRTITVYNATDGMQIDCEAEWIISGGVPQMGACTGDFPRIPAGESTVQFTGSITELVIAGRWRYL